MNNNTPLTGTITVALADDHQLLLNGLAMLINSFGNCTVLYTALNGQELIDKVQQQGPPQVLILDMSMPQMDGHQTALWLRQHYPDVKILMLTMHSTDAMLIQLLTAGVKGFLKKDVAPAELQRAIAEVTNTGFYFGNQAVGQIVRFLNNTGQANQTVDKSLLTDKEIEFLILSCSELTYKSIANQMGMNPSTLDNMRAELFAKLQVSSRVGLALYAIKQGLVTI